MHKAITRKLIRDARALSRDADRYERQRDTLAKKLKKRKHC